MKPDSERARCRLEEYDILLRKAKGQGRQHIQQFRKGR